MSDAESNRTRAVPDDRRPAADEIVRAEHRRVLFAFDFDETFAPNTTDALLRSLDVDPERFRAEKIEPLVDDGWDERLAEATALVDLSASLAEPITEATFARVAAELELYPGVTDLFDRLRDEVASVADDIDVEFHLITAGFVHVPEATVIAGEFASIRGGHWHFDHETGGITTPMNTLGHDAKVRHLQALAKGLDDVRSTAPTDVDADIPERDWHAPFEQIVFVGDGDSDLPCFGFLARHAGTAIAVRQRPFDDWESRPGMRRGRRVATLVASDYRPDSPLSRALSLAARRAAMWVELVATADR